LWNEVIGPEVKQIITSVFPTGPCTIDAVSIGYNPDKAHGGILPAGNPTIWIGVERGVISQETGQYVVDEIKRRCKESGLEDMRVEIRESRLSNLSALIDPALVPPEIRITGLAEDLTASLGVPIASELAPDSLGTGGLVFTVPGLPYYIMITAAHVLVPNSDGDRSSSHPLQSSPGPKVRLHTKESFAHLMQNVDEAIEQIDYSIGSIQDAIKTADPTTAAGYRRTIDGWYLYQKASLESWRSQLKASSPESRTLGTILLRPPLDLGVTTAASEYRCTRDYCLIQTDLNPALHPDFNTLRLVPGAEMRIANKCATAFPTRDDDQSRTIRATGKYVPILDLLGEDARARVVLKRGARTGLTVGTTNRLKSFRRMDVEFSDEVLVIGMDTVPFSAEGDSGATVIDRAGDAVGIVTSGPLDLAELTYVTPMAWIMEDIK